MAEEHVQHAGARTAPTPRGPHPLWFQDEGTGRTILFLHSLGASSALWDRQLGALSGQYRCIAPDLPGHGHSPRGDAITAASIGAALLQLLDDLKLTQVDLVGLSMGGAWALQLWSTAKGRVSSLLLCNAMPRWDLPEAQIAVRAQRLAIGSMADYGVQAAAQLRDEVPAEIRKAFSRTFARCTKQSFLEAAVACFYADVTGLLREVSVPCAFVAGELDECASESVLHSVADLNPRIVQRVLPHVGHIAPIDNPDEFHAILTEWLESVPR